MRVAIAQFYTQNVSYGKYSEAINKKYCEEKGYTYIVEKNDKKLREWAEDRAFTWIKPKFILEILQNQNFNYILFLDIDAIVSNFSIKIEEFIDENYDIIATQDYGSHSLMNAGVLLIKNSSWCLDFMKDWWDAGYYLTGPDVPELETNIDSKTLGYFKNALWHDQTCLSYLYKRSDRRNHIKIIDNKSLNWREDGEGNFIFHAFSYGNIPNRRIDQIHNKIFNIQADSKSLVDLANFYQTDKEYQHKYISNYYENIMSPIREEVKRICEIGVGKLGSLKMWRDYFENAQIVGCDIVNFEEKNNRIEIIKMDQSKEEELNRFCEEQEDFDLIIDDGSHKMHDQQITFAKLFKKIKPGGFYIIEDLHTSIEAKMSEKAIFGWGDPEKTTTIEMLEKFIETGSIQSNYLSEEDVTYLTKNIDFCKILRKDNNNDSITSLIGKKK